MPTAFTNQLCCGCSTISNPTYSPVFSEQSVWCDSFRALSCRSHTLQCALWRTYLISGGTKTEFTTVISPSTEGYVIRGFYKPIGLRCWIEPAPVLSLNHFRDITNIKCFWNRWCPAIGWYIPVTKTKTHFGILLCCSWPQISFIIKKICCMCLIVNSLELVRVQWQDAINQKCTYLCAHLPRREYRIWPDATGAIFSSYARSSVIPHTSGYCASVSNFTKSKFFKF